MGAWGLQRRGVRQLVLASMFCASPVLALDGVTVRLASGADAALEPVLQQASTVYGLLDEDTPTGRDVLAAAQGDYATLVEALYAQGYYGPVVRIALDGVEAARIDPFAAPGQVSTVVIDVDPGQKFRFGTARIAPLAPDTAAPDAFAEGEPALAGVVRQTARGAVRDWREAGHAQARITDQIVVARHEAARLDVTLGVTPGARLRFGEVEVTTPSAVRAPRIRQIAGVPRGETFTVSDLEKAASRLRQSGVFSSVRLVEAAAANADGTLDIGIEVTDRAPRRIGGGVELSSLDGLRLTGYWLHRNILGGAERLRFDGDIRQIGSGQSGVDYDLSTRFEKPAVYGPDTLFFAEASVSHADEPTYLEDRAELTFGVTREFSDRLTVELGLGAAVSRVDDRNGSVRDLIVLSMPVGVTYDGRDDALNPSRGVYADMMVTPFRETRSGADGVRYFADMRAYQSLGARAVLAGRVQLGAVTGAGIDEIAPEDLFFSGGGGTVRGQPYQALDAEYGTARRGGRNFIGLSAEMRVVATDAIGVVGFADAGFVGSSSVPGEDGEWHSGAGLGVRYQTPVGPIRLDVAAPLSGNTGEGVQLYLGIGQAF